MVRSRSAHEGRPVSMIGLWLVLTVAYFTLASGGRAADRHGFLSLFVSSPRGRWPSHDSERSPPVPGQHESACWPGSRIVSHGRRAADRRHPRPPRSGRGGPATPKSPANAAAKSTNRGNSPLPKPDLGGIPCCLAVVVGIDGLFEHRGAGLMP